MIFTWHARLIFYELNTQTHYWDTFRIVVLVLCMCSNKLVQSDRYLLLPRLTFQHIFDMFLFQAACEIHTILVLASPNFLFNYFCPTASIFIKKIADSRLIKT